MMVERDSVLGVGTGSTVAFLLMLWVKEKKRKTFL